MGYIHDQTHHGNVKIINDENINWKIQNKEKQKQNWEKRKNVGSESFVSPHDFFKFRMLCASYISVGHGFSFQLKSAMTPIWCLTFTLKFKIL